MLNLMAGFLSPTAGQVLTQGKAVTGPGADRGVVFQRDTLFLWKRVRDNIGFGPKARGVPKEERERIVDGYLKLIGWSGSARPGPSSSPAGCGDGSRSRPSSPTSPRCC